MPVMTVNSTPFLLTLRHFRWHWGVQIRKKIFRNMIFLNMKFIKFHGIPWNFKKVPWNSMEQFWGKLKVLWNSIEFRGTREYGKVPWNSMELWIWTKFHGIPWNLRFCCSSSMEFHGTTGVVQMLFKKFHGTLRKVPWNFLIKVSFNDHWRDILNDILIRNEWCRKCI